jgi:hypothetical protein
MAQSRKSGRGSSAAAAEQALAVELAEIERNARAALAAVEAVAEQAEVSRSAVELVLTEVAELAAELSTGAGPRDAINNSTVSQGARVLAVQLAAAGESKEEVSDRLRDQFGIDDTGQLLDAIFRRRGDA